VDLTNILRVADVICVRDPEVPDLIELKGKNIIMPLSLLGQKVVPNGFEEITKDKPIRGRTGRQISLMLGISEYLRSGQAKVFGTPQTKVAIETSIAPEHHWKEVEKVASEAIAHGYAAARLGERHWLLAQNEGEELQKEDGLVKELASAKQIMIAAHCRPLEETWTSISTPFNWSLSDPVRFALMEGDVVVVTVFDVSTLVGRTYSDATIEEVLVFDDHLGPESLKVSFEGERFTVSNRALLEVLYQFRSVESMVHEVCDFVVKSVAFHKPYRIENGAA